MKPSISACLAFASACLAIAEPRAERPQYGGTLRAATAGIIRSMNPTAAASDAAEVIVRERVLPLAFETLTRVDAESGLEPMLAVSWTSDRAAVRWTVRLRNGITLQDGVPLESWQAAASLRAVEPRWKVTNDGDTLTIETPDATPDLPWRLAGVDHSITAKSASGDLVGTGPFRLERLDGSDLLFRAYDGYWASRAFLDRIQIQMGRPNAAQLSDLESGRAEFVSIQPTDVRRLAQRGMRTVASRPLELVALAYEPHRSSDSSLSARCAVGSAINRQAIADVLLQQQAIQASALLPSWLSGYSLKAAGLGLSSAGPAPAAPPRDQRELILRVDPSDFLLQAVAERIALDLRERGFAPKVQAPEGLAPRADARLVRVRLNPSTPDRVFSELVGRLGALAGGDVPAQIAPQFSLDAVVRSESAMLDRCMVIPIVHLRDVYAVADRLASGRSTPVTGTGVWNLADVWLRNDRP
jgi:hypothetical protein